MKPTLTRQEYEELNRLLQIVQDPSRQLGERIIARAQFERIYEKAVKRTAQQQRLLELA